MTEIVFVTDYLERRSGGPRFLLDVLTFLTRSKNIKVTIITGYVSEETMQFISAFRDIQVLNLNYYFRDKLPHQQPINVARFLFKAAYTLRELLREHSDVVLHLNSHFPNLLALIDKSEKIPVICSIHHLEDIGAMHSFLGKIGLKIIQDFVELNLPCDIIHTPSHYVKELIRQKIIFKYRGIIAIPPGIDIKKYMSIPKRVEKGLFLMIGRLEQRKHYDHAFAAFKILTKHRPHYKLIVVGNGPLKSKLMQLVKKYSLEGKVFLLGSVDEKTKVQLLSKAEALIHLGYPEGFGVVVIEALASGTPVIAYDVPPINEVVKHNITGVLVKKNDIAGLVKAITSMNRITYDSKLLQNSVRCFDISEIARQFYILYSRLASVHFITRSE